MSFILIKQRLAEVVMVMVFILSTHVLYYGFALHACLCHINPVNNQLNETL